MVSRFSGPEKIFSIFVDRIRFPRKVAPLPASNATNQPNMNANTIAKVRQHFAGEYPSQLVELDWIINSSLPPHLVTRGHLTVREWYHAVRRMLSRAEFQW